MVEPVRSLGLRVLLPFHDELDFFLRCPLNLTLLQLSVFKIFVKTGGLKKAAEVMPLSETEISGHLQTLEKNIGLPLFTTHQQQVHVTEAGKEVLIYADSIDIPLRVLKGAIREIQSIQSGRLNIAMPEEAHDVMPKLVTKFSHHFPGIDVYLDVCERSSLIHQVNSGKTDIAVIESPVPQYVEGLSFSPLTTKWYSVYRNDQPLSPAAQSFCAYMNAGNPG